MEKGYLRIADRDLKGWKASSTEFRENEFVANLAHRTRGKAALVLKGIIMSMDKGVIGKPLAEFRVQDKGSFKEISFHRPNGETVLHCRFMEGEIR